MSTSIGLASRFGKSSTARSRSTTTTSGCGHLSRPRRIHEVADELGRDLRELAMELVRLVDAGDQIVSLIVMRATGRGSGVSVERKDAIVSTFRDGKITRIDYYNDQAQALEAVGLSEQDAHADS